MPRFKKAVAEVVKLSEAQIEELARLRKEQRDLTTAVRREIAAIFTRVQGTSNDQARTQRAKSDFANVAYGPHERSVLDLYLAESKTPTPLAIYIHGGGFRGGSKGSV